MKPKYKVGSILRHKALGDKFLIVVRSLLSRSYVCEDLDNTSFKTNFGIGTYSRTELRRSWILLSDEEVVILKLEGIL